MITSIKKNKGFTIVELLVVIVVIGILAAITIVSYGGMTGRSNTAAGQTAADATNNKASLYSVSANASTVWPATWGALTAAQEKSAYNLNSGKFAVLGLTANTPPAVNSTLEYQLCGTKADGSAAANYGEIAIGTGIKVGYYDNGDGNIKYQSTGIAVNCYKPALSNVLANLGATILSEGTKITSATAFSNAAKLADLTVVTTAVGTDTKKVQFFCGAPTGATDCTASNVNGGRLAYYDTAARTVDYGTSTVYFAQ